MSMQKYFASSMHNLVTDLHAKMSASYIYAALLVAGGAAGFAKGSTASLVAGGMSGVAVLALEYLFSSSAAARGSTAIAMAELVVSGALTYVMSQRYANSGKFMPAGLVAILSGLMSVFYSLRLYSLMGAKGHTA